MIQINITHELDQLRKKLNNIERQQIPFATAKALTETGKKVKAAEVGQMKKVFDRPTKFTLNSLFLDRATKKDLVATVWLKDWALKGTPATKYLAPQIMGGQRKLKGFEVLLNARGILPDGYYAVPSRKARKDAYGNINKGLLNQILSYSGAQRDQAQNTKQGKKRQTKAKFVVLDRNGSKPGGIWQIDKSNNLYPILIFVKKPKYNERFDFFGTAQKTIDKHLKEELRKSIAYSLKTAKR